MLPALLLLAAGPAVTLRPVAIPAEPRGEAPRSPYRLDPAVETPYDGKGAAVRTTGSQCAITGPTLCTRKPRTLYAAPLGQ